MRWPSATTAPTVSRKAMPARSGRGTGGRAVGVSAPYSGSSSDAGHCPRTRRVARAIESLPRPDCRCGLSKRAAHRSRSPRRQQICNVAWIERASRGSADSIDGAAKGILRCVLKDPQARRTVSPRSVHLAAHWRSMTRLIRLARGLSSLTFRSSHTSLGGTSSGRFISVRSRL